MTILFLTRLFYPHIGGVEKHVLEISKRLLQMGHTVIVITEELSQKEMEKATLPEELTGLQVYRIPAGREGKMKKFRVWEWLYQHKNIIRNANIVHCHDVFFWYLPFRFIFPFKKVFTTFHGYETKVPPDQKAIRMRKLSERLSRGNICVGSFIEKWYSTNATIVTYGATSISKDYSSTSINERKIKIAFVGRLEKDTGVSLYIEVVRLLRHKGIEVTFNIYGDGSLRKEFEKIGTVHGFVPDVTSAIAKTDVLFASSYLSILDGLAAGKLIIAMYENKLKRDYLQMTPYSECIFISDNPRDITEDFINILTNDKKRRYMIEKGQDYAKTQTWDHLTKQYLSLWKK